MNFLRLQTGGQWQRRTASFLVVIVAVLGCYAVASASVARHDARIASLVDREAALRASVAKLGAEHEALRSEIAVAQEAAKQARCDADFEKVTATATVIQARAFADQARHRQCVAEVERSNSQTAGGGCSAGMLLGGPLGMLVCGTSLVVGDSATERCGLEPHVPTIEAAHDEAVRVTGVTLNDSCLLAHVAMAAE